jgi:glyoxylase-like metal-dependent hydrolase (beta-lactamase superfamily II)
MITMTMAHASGWPEILPRPIHRQLTHLTSLDPWFEIYQVSDGVYSIVEPYHYEETISYLITGRDRAVLIDTGMGVADIRAEVENLTKLPVTLVNSHWHWDHVGGNYQFKDIWAFDNDFEVGKIERGMTVEECAAAGFLRPESLCRPLPAGFDPATYELRRCTVTRRLKHLEQIDLGGRALVIHHAPGHSPGGICIYDTKDRILFTGDVYYPGTLYANLERSDFSVFYPTMVYLTSMAPLLEWVSPSHNESKVPAAELVAAAAGFHKVMEGTAQYTITGGLGGQVRLYDFGRFRLERPLETPGE